MEPGQSRLVTVLDALSEKYSEENCVADGFEHIQLSSKQRAGLKVKGLFPNKHCRILALDGWGITSAGRPGEIAAICPDISELDISNNSVGDWDEVCKILAQLKKLRSLNLCGNNLSDSNYSSALYINNFEANMFHSLSELALNNTNVSLDTVKLLLKDLPNVEELHLSLNGYSFVPECEECFKSVKRLHFNGNAIQQWQEVENLGRMFPHLVSLVIMENPLENISRENEESSLHFLNELCLTNTMLNSWEHVDAIRCFKSLTKLKLIGIPLVACLTESKAREYTLARLPNIQCLNGSRVLDTEREKAERSFVREYVDDESPPRRYHELVAIHGKLSKLADVNLAPAEYADVLMHITGRAPYVQTIYLRQTLFDFKKYCSNMLGIPVKKLALFFKDMEINYVPEKMVYNVCKLSAYKIKDGDEIYVEIL